MRTIFFIVTWLLASSCTKSREEPPAPAPETRAQPELIRPTDVRPAIVVLGDSLAEGLGVGAGKSFPDLLQRKLDENGYKYRVVNLGVSGDTTTGGLGRLEYALSLKPEVLVLELGGNDGLRGIPVASSGANLEKMIVAAKKAGAEVLLAGMTLPPNYGADYIRAFEGTYKDLARKHKLAFIPFLMQEIAAHLKVRPDLMQPDGIHPSASGHELIAATVFQYLKPMLTRPSEAHRPAAEVRP